MAKSVLPTDFQDDILSSSMNGKRRYRMNTNTDGTQTLEDVSEYDQVGSEFGAAQLNSMNQAVNESADNNKIIDDLEDIDANTQQGYIAGALALKELNTNMSNINLFVNEDGQLVFTDKDGADSVIPFSVNIDFEAKIAVRCSTQGRWHNLSQNYFTIIVCIEYIKGILTLKGISGNTLVYHDPGDDWTQINVHGATISEIVFL